MKFIVKKDSYLLDYLKEIFSKSISKTTLRSWLQNGLVQVDGRTVFQPLFFLKDKQTISIFPRPKKIIGSLKIVYEDRFFIAIEKPSGMLSVPTDYKKHCNVLHVLRKNGYFSTYPVHRLDKETSGIMIFAKNKKSQQLLKKMFEKHDIIRKYYAIVEGNMKEEKGVWKNYLRENPDYSMSICNSNEGKLAITRFEKIKQFKQYSFVAFYLETGKKHQIRLQCASRKNPVAGDKKYGSKTNPTKRMSLHASFLGFLHPISKKPMHFCSPLPLEFQKMGAYDSLEKPSSLKSLSPC